MAGLSFVALSSIACRSPASVIRPVIYAQDDEAASAMRSAPLIVLARISDLSMTGDGKCVEKPPEVGGPMCPSIPLYLARIRADVLLTLRGAVQDKVEFYSWIWASGSHGGPRLFHPNPGKIRVLFLRREAGYWHTVGDYPSYDLELPSRWVPALMSNWKSGHENRPDPLERLVALRFRAEFEALSVAQLREDFDSDGPHVNHYWATDLPDLIRVVGPFFVATQLDNICQHSANPSARLAACFVAGEYFPGRCEAFRLAQEANSGGIGGDFLARQFRSCQIADRDLATDLLSGNLSRSRFGGWSFDSRHRREWLRVYASAMNRSVHLAACEVAARTSEARDIQECAAPLTSKGQKRPTSIRGR
ncbi:MAG: hypothetical protein LAP87_25995 [Acidobacteriia bacterium]|nr:hypothetical protein [Terriglobia bacterium]